MYGRFPSLCFFVALLAVASWPPCSSWAEDAKSKTASLGAETRNPTEEEAKTYGLGSHKVGCVNGQYLTTIEKDGPADRAGLKANDMIVALDANTLYSQDDLFDLLRVLKPGAKAEAVVKRAGTFKEERVTLTLGASLETSTKGIVWQHAGAGQLDSALGAAKKEGKLVLVGLSGADT